MKNIVSELLETARILETLNENIDAYNDFILSIKSPYQLLKWMDKNIKYDLDESSNYKTKTGKELWISKKGQCAEQTYFEKDVLENLGYKIDLWHVKEQNRKYDYKHDGSAHVFLTYADNDKIFWFEHSMEHAKGIHKCSSIKDVFQKVSNQWWRCRYDYSDISGSNNDRLADILEFRKMDKPISGINIYDLSKKCYRLPVVYTEDISDNKFEPLNENIIFNEKNHLYNFDKFIDGKTNILIVTGFSGSGKSTMARRLAEDCNGICIELDSLSTYIMDKDVDVKEFQKEPDGDILLSFVKKEHIVRGNTDIDFYEIFNKYFDHIKQYCNAHKDKRFIINGLQIYELIDKNKYAGFPMVILGNSAIKSSFRAARRDSAYEKKYSDNPRSFINILCARLRDAFKDNRRIEDTKKFMKDSTPKIQYRKISDVNKFKQHANKLLGGHGNPSKDKEIVIDDKIVGYIGFSSYTGNKNDDFKRALGIGDFMILDPGQGIGSSVMHDVVMQYMKDYDLIYCYVDKDNTRAINFYKKIGKVSNELNDNNQYYVELYKR